VTVEVRGGDTGAPVAGALVLARPVHFFVPAHPYPILDPSPPRSARGLTDAAGAVRLRVIAQHPVQFVVVAPGYTPLMLPPGCAQAGGPWTDGGAVDEDVGVRRLEMRLSD
jgi:hypothetical protein